MARGRMISQSVSTDKRFNELSTEAALVFLMTVPHLDRDGLILADACILAGQVCTRRRELAPMMQSILDEWINLGVVISYEYEDGTILFFTGFAKNQAGMRYDREPKSTLPVPPGYKRTGTGLEPEDLQPESADMSQVSGNLPASIRQSSARAGAEGKGIEVEVEVEGKGNVRAHKAKPNDSKPLPPSLGVFREHCPKPINATQTDAIASAITDLGLWRQVLTEWGMRGYNMGNVRGLLDWYKDGIPPVAMNGAKRGTRAKGNQPDVGDDALKLDPERQRQYAERAERKRSQSP